MKKYNYFVISIILIFIAAEFFLTNQKTFAGVARCKGQTVYVPVYSQINSGDKQENILNLTVTLSIRNTDPDHSMTIARVDYYDSKGNHLKKYLQKSLKLNPLGATEFVIHESDRTVNAGANFMVIWQSENIRITEPIVETIMVGANIQQGISFISRGQIIKEFDCKTVK